MVKMEPGESAAVIFDPLGVVFSERLAGERFFRQISQPVTDWGVVIYDTRYILSASIEHLQRFRILGIGWPAGG